MNTLEYIIMQLFTVIGWRKFWYDFIYLNSEHWRRTRRRRLKIAHYSCDVCGYHGRLEVHHKTYVRIGRERMGDLDVFCRFHHKQAHQ